VDIGRDRIGNPKTMCRAAKFCCLMGAFLAVGILTEMTRAGEIPFEKAWTPFGGGPRGPGDGVLVDHQPHNFGGPMADTNGFESVGGEPIWQLVADDFSLPVDATIRRIVFWGFYNYGIEPTSNEEFEIEFHHPRSFDGLPGETFYEATFLNPAREWTGRNVISAGGGREYRFEADLPSGLTLPAGEAHWLSLHQLGDPSTAFRWETSATPLPLNGTAYNNPIVGDWRHTMSSVNNAFQLSSVPEPSSLSSVLLYLVVFLRRPRRRSSCKAS